MSGILQNRNNKKNGKKIPLNPPKVLQVQSVKLSTKANKNVRSNAKSEENFKRPKTLSALSRTSEIDTCTIEKMRKLSLDTGGENCLPSTSANLLNQEEHSADTAVQVNKEDDIPLMESADDYAQYAGHFNYYSKNSKSIKFTNQVTVLYFNGEDVLCESMEPLKKDSEQQIRNKEMRKNHLISRGHEIDNVCLF